MKNSTYPAFVAILLGACGTGELEQRAAEPQSDASCSLTSPPSDSRTIETHGLDFYIYPATLPTAYNGCQIMWAEDGTQLAVARYVNGKIRSFNGKEPKEDPFECTYADDGTIAQATDPNQCLPAAEFPM